MISALIDILAIYYQAGDMAQEEVIARSMLAAIPDDMVALQFLGLALYKMGHLDQAYRVFKQVVVRTDPIGEPDGSVACETASIVSYREATRPHSVLADAWYQISVALQRIGLHQPAIRALEVSHQMVSVRPVPQVESGNLEYVKHR
jgi:tetratricopeptide (TPR) repeat protein